jgi:transposase InsO family protein
VNIGRRRRAELQHDVLDAVLAVIVDRGFYQSLDQGGISDNIHLFNENLREWEDYYNYHRPHGALDGQTPYERLLAKTRAEVSPGS